LRFSGLPTRGWDSKGGADKAHGDPRSAGCDRAAGIRLGPERSQAGESDQTARAILGGRQPIVPSGGLPIVDVRDVAAALAAVFRLLLGPRRYLLGGHYVTFPELLGLFRELSGRRLPVLTLPETLILPVAHAADLVQRLLPFRIPIPTGGIWLTKQQARCDDSRAEAELGFAPRDLRETLADTVRSLLETGRLTPKQAGKLGSA
jgi:nucleoside-diphosphate-sugar epimerase